MQLPQPKSNVANMEDHPRRVRIRISDIVSRSAVTFNMNFNDLDAARKVQISEIWACLESGEIDDDSVSAGGRYLAVCLAKEHAGRCIYLQVFLYPGHDGKEWLEVIEARYEEEE